MTSVSFRDRRRLAAVYKAALQAPVFCERHGEPRVVIVAVEARIPAAVRSWVLREDRSGFDEELMDSVERAVAGPAGESAGPAGSKGA